MGIEAEIRLPHTRAASDLARQAISRELEGILTRPRLDDALLIVSELASNAVRHAPATVEDEIELRVVIDPNRVLLVIVDGGNDFTPDWPTDDDVRSSRMGLLLVDSVSDAWGISDDGTNAVWAEVSRAR